MGYNYPDNLDDYMILGVIKNRELSLFNFVYDYFKKINKLIKYYNL